MSHFATITTLIKDIEALRAACAEMVLSWYRTLKPEGTGANRHHGDHVIKLKGLYDIAVNRQRTVRSA